MATTSIVWCLVINHENKPLGNVFSVRIPSTDSVADLKKAIKKKTEPVLNHFAANELCVWKVCPRASTQYLASIVMVLLFIQQVPTLHI
jgi:hypothetical protein